MIRWVVLKDNNFGEILFIDYKEMRKEMRMDVVKAIEYFRGPFGKLTTDNKQKFFVVYNKELWLEYLERMEDGDGNDKMEN